MISFLLGILSACRQAETFEPVYAVIGPATAVTVTATLTPDFELNGAGSDVDSIAFWETANANDVLMFVTAKASQLVEVWQFPFIDNEQTPLTHTTFGTSGTRVNGVVVDQTNDLLYVSVSNPESTVAVFTLPGLTFAREFISGDYDLKSEPNIDLLDHADGSTRAYVSADQILYIYNANTGQYISQFTPTKGLETVLADDLWQIIYVPDEKDKSGVYAYTPDGAPYPQAGSNQFGADNIFQSDAEGITMYHCPPQGVDNGKGFIIVADQKADVSDFEFFDRQSWAHLGTLNITGVSNTDGIASTQQALPGYPQGIFVAINDDKSAVGVGWDKVLTAMGLSCDNATAVAPNLSITKQNNQDVDLSWTAHVGNNCNHEVFKSSTPFFDPASTGVLLTTTISTTFPVSMILGDAAVNNFFRVRAINCDASSTAISNEVGEFDFTLIAD